LVGRRYFAAAAQRAGQRAAEQGIDFRRVFFRRQSVAPEPVLRRLSGQRPRYHRRGDAGAGHGVGQAGGVAGQQDA